jgi:hypothetical protein
MVYLDRLRNWGWRYGPSCHMIADTDEELHAFAASLGLKPRWAQRTKDLHYDLTASRREAAVEKGAIELADQGFVLQLRRLREKRKMARLWKKTDGTREGKYLVMRRDRTIPEWLWFVLGSRDPAAPAGLRGYADEAEKLGFDPEYVADVRALAVEYEEDFKRRGPGDPDAGPHRVDDPATIAEMRKGNGS